MASPLADAGFSSLNSATPTKDIYRIHNEYQVTMQSNVDSDSDGPPSSPFVTNVSDVNYNRENISPSKISRLTSKSPIDREPTSPLKMLKNRPSRNSQSQSPSPCKDSNPLRSPRKMSSPEKRFPVKPSSPIKVMPQEKPTEQTLSIEDVLRDNEGLTRAIEILEDEDSEMEHASDDTLIKMGAAPSQQEHYNENMDDTMASTFSNFSAVPDMTMFAKIRHSPSKLAGPGPTPRRTQINTPATLRRPVQDRSPSPTPRGHRYGSSKDEGNTTNLILDFTDQFNGFSGRAQYSPRKHSPLKSATMPDMSYMTTPTVNRHNISNLLDFDIPPAPTPRSMPSITPRELESLKSNFLSEVSSLKASLSGKEAEIQSLKTAVGDAEKRVGESLELVREERSMKEQMASEKEEWENRSREMEAVLRNVKEEIVHGDRERNELEGRLDESERRRDAAEIMAQEAESKMAAIKAGKPSDPSDNAEAKSGDCECGGRAVELAVEKVSRELHTLYKDKHETKVSALKKSYEKRWEKKVKELEMKIEDLTRENEEIKLGRDTTMTKVEPKHSLEATIDLEKQAAQDARARELEAELEGLAQEVRSVKHDNTELRKMLDDERVENGKLVAALDEMIPLVAACDEILSNQMENSAPPASQNVTPAPIRSNVENLRGSISRASGLRAPGSMAQGESRIGRGGFGVPAGNGHERTRSGSAQGIRPGSGLGYRSGIMASIEKMGDSKRRND